MDIRNLKQDYSESGSGTLIIQTVEIRHNRQDAIQLLTGSQSLNTETNHDIQEPEGNEVSLRPTGEDKSAAIYSVY